MVKYHQIDMNMDIKDEDKRVNKRVAFIVGDTLQDALRSINEQFSHRIEQAQIAAGEKNEFAVAIDRAFIPVKEPKLFFSLTGKAKYITALGNTYRAEFSKSSDAYILLHYLVGSPRQSFTVSRLNSIFTAIKTKDEKPETEWTQRKILNTINDIRKGFKLTNDNPDDFFMNSRKSYGVNCIVEIRE